MKAKTILAVTTLVMSAGIALAAEDKQEHKTHHPDAAGVTAKGNSAMPGGGMPMMQMKEHMQKMRTQMAEIHRTEDPDKRDELIQSHMADMQEMMKMMQGMHGGKSMMGQGMTGGKMMGGQQGDNVAAPQGGMKGGQQAGMMEMMNRQQMMEQRMDMMQMMMNQMVQDQAAREETRKIRERRHDHRKTK